MSVASLALPLTMRSPGSAVKPSRPARLVRKSRLYSRREPAD